MERTGLEPTTGQRGSRLVPALLAAVEAVAYIPQPGRVGSLNAVVAAAIAMAEARRREWHPKA